MKNIHRLPQRDDIHNALGVAVEPLSQLTYAAAELWQRFGIQRRPALLHLTHRWPKEAFTGSGIAEMSSLLLAIHTTGFGSKVSETSISGCRGGLFVF